MSRKIQIILAEDEPAILRGISANITQFSQDYEISYTAYNGKDALEKITKQRPDIVITDIRMPLMNGLDLIDAASKVSPDTYFVILTGYAEFEYARRAMKLHVADYLLKPVDPDALEALLKKLKSQLLEKREKEVQDYLTQCLHLDTPNHSRHNPVCGCVVYLLFAFYGSVTASIYNELTTGSLLVQDSDYSFLPEIADLLNIRILALRGNYRNETIFAIIDDSTQNVRKTAQTAKKAAELIHSRILSEITFINCILSEAITDGADIPFHVRSCYLYAASQIIFGKSCIMNYETLPSQAENMTVTPEIKELLCLLKPAMSPDEIAAFSKSLVTCWANQNASQLQIQTDIRFTFNTSVLKTESAQNSCTAPSELLASSSSYEELYHNLILELKKLWAGQNKSLPKMPHTQELANKVQGYLDRHYTQSITYKSFTEVFGYNEKYISYIFKEEFGISPSKYILELRLTAAKNLICRNPDIRLKDVAEAVGYDDPLYFSRVFKNSEGISPKAYQKQQGHQCGENP